MKNDKTKELLQQLETGVQEVFSSDKYKEMLDIMGKFHNYSANNCILIMAQYPSATLVAGYKSWEKNFNRHVKKGSKGIRILAPTKRKYQRTYQDEDGYESEETIEYMSYYPITVFDISQTEGQDLPSVTKVIDSEVSGYNKVFQNILNTIDIPVEFGETGSANGYYSHKDNKIVIREGMPQGQTIKTLIHERAHSILHSKDGVAPDTDKRTKEVQAESIAYIVCSQLGIDTSDYSFGYIAGWSSGKETKELKASLEIIHKTAKDILEAIEKNSKM